MEEFIKVLKYSNTRIRKFVTMGIFNMSKELQTIRNTSVRADSQKLMQKCFKLTSFRHKYQDLDFRSLHKYENMIAVVFLDCSVLG